MKTELIIISLALVMLVFLPFFLFPYIQMRDNNKLQKKFKKEAERLKLNIDLKESWNLKVIGIDSLQKKLLLVQRIDNRFMVEFIDLNIVKQSNVVVSHFEMTVDGKKENILEKVNLEFSFIYGEEKKIVNLYDYDLNYTQDLEIKHAENWNNNIKKFISAQPYLKKTA